jgi:hypothetical protein
LLAVEALCSSAKKQDYEAFRTSRQALLFFVSLCAHASFARDRTIASHSLLWQGKIINLRFIHTHLMPSPLLATSAGAQLDRAINNKTKPLGSWAYWKRWQNKSA